MLFKLPLRLKEVISQNHSVHYIGNLMMLGQLFHGLVLIILEDGNLCNIWQKDYMKILLLSTDLQQIKYLPSTISYMK